MRQVYRVVLFLIAAASTNVAVALDCEMKEIVSYFGNGMFNSQVQAYASRAALEEFMAGRYLIKQQNKVKLAYNFSEAIAEQLLQVMEQKNADVGRSFFKWVGNLSSAPVFFRNAAQTAMAAYDLTAYLNDGDLQAQIREYETDLKKGHSIVVVGHSQGNFYSNMSWENLTRIKKYRGRLALVGVAAPVGYIAGNGPYTTMTQDAVISFVRHQKGALPANVANSTASARGHEFVRHYLAGSESSQHLHNNLKNVISGLASDTAVPSPAALEFLDESLAPFLHHACKLQATKAKFTDGECIALAALDRTYGWFGERREARSLTALNEWIDQCDTKELWRSPTRFDFMQCSMLSFVPSLDPAGSVKAELVFVAAEHPECNWQNQEVGRRTTRDAVSTARALLNNPPKVFRLKGE